MLSVIRKQTFGKFDLAPLLWLSSNSAEEEIREQITALMLGLPLTKGVPSRPVAAVQALSVLASQNGFSYRAEKQCNKYTSTSWFMYKTYYTLV